MNEQHQQAINYIEKLRSEGYGDDAIRQHLETSGWTTDAVNAYLQPGQQTQPLTKSNTTYTQKKTKLPRISKLTLILITIIALLGSSLIYVVVNKQTSNSQFEPGFSKFTDTDFSVEVPKSWSTDSGYEPGKGLVMMYSPENGPENLREQAANMIVFVSDDSHDRIEQQKASLEKAGGTYQTLRDETRKFGSYSGRFVEIIVTSKQEPDKKMHVLSLAVKGAQRQYYMDLTALDEHWHIHAKNAEHILDTFAPLK
jgi:hypothetical protein